MIKKGMFIGNRYEVLDKVGSGGMSDVYKAKDHKLNRFVAIKVLKHEFCIKIQSGSAVCCKTRTYKYCKCL